MGIMAVSKSIIEIIQEDDPSYDPLKRALVESKYDWDQWKAACSRVYTDGYYGPVNTEEWAETTGWKPISVNDARELIARVLDKVEDYLQDSDNQFMEIYSAEDIRAALVPFYGEIYGQRYPQIGVGGNVY